MSIRATAYMMVRRMRNALGRSRNESCTAPGGVASCSGFTLLEMMIALSLSAIILTAIGGLMLSIWTMAWDTSIELDAAIKSRYRRDLLMRGMRVISDGSVTNVYALVNATNILVNSQELVAYFEEKDAAALSKVDGVCSISILAGTNTVYCLDDTRTPDDFAAAGYPMRYVYLRDVPDSRTECWDRIVVTMFNETTTPEQISETFGLPDE